VCVLLPSCVCMYILFFFVRTLLLCHSGVRLYKYTNEGWTCARLELGFGSIVCSPTDFGGAMGPPQNRQACTVLQFKLVHVAGGGAVMLPLYCWVSPPPRRHPLSSWPCIHAVSLSIRPSVRSPVGLSVCPSIHQRV